MKRGISLIEILIVIVMASIILPSIIKIYSVIEKNTKFAVNFEIFTPAISLVKYISSLPWDQNTSASGEILLTDSKNIYLECNKSSKIRIGSFSKERNCKHLLKASNIGEDNENFINDLDDYEGKKLPFYKNRKRYEIKISINYIDDNIISYDYNQKSAILDLSKSKTIKKSSNIKEIKATLLEKNKTIASFNYFSANLGEILIRREEW